MPIFVPSQKPHQNHIETLTSLRFVAAFWVLILHLANEYSFDHESVTMFVAKGKLGVDFFFILSGFIMAHVYLAKMEAGRFAFGDFIKKRFARLYPLHLATFLFVAAYVAAGRMVGIEPGEPEAYTWSSVLPNLLMLHAWGLDDTLSFNYVSWSISAEWFAYLTFWPMALLTLRRRPLAMLGASLALFLVMYATSGPIFGRQLTYLNSDFGIARILPEFMIGVALYRVSRSLDLRASYGWITGLLVVGLIFVAHDDSGDWIAVPILGSLIFAAASLERQGGLAWLRARVLIYLGEISYSIYMVHGIVMTLWFKTIEMTIGLDNALGITIGAFSVPASLAAAAVAYHVIEVPSRRFLNKHLTKASFPQLKTHQLSQPEPASRPSR